MAQELKYNITLLGLFPLPDIFVNKENFKSDEIKKGVYEIPLGERYEYQKQLPINFEYFKGPGELPDKRDKNDFWGSVLGYGVWAPLFYKSIDDLNIEIISCKDENTTDLFNKLSLIKKAPTRFFIRIFPIGGYSVHMVFDFTISNNSECFTVEDLKTMVEDLFDRINFKLKTKSKVIISDITISKIFERFGSMIRNEFLRNPNQMHLGMTKHAIIDIDKYKGDWRKEDIEDLAGGYIKKLGTKPEDLLTGRDNTIITSDVYYSGEICTLLALTTTTEKGKKSLKNKTIDVAEFVHLRKLIVEEYTKHITQKNIEIAGNIDDLNYLNALKDKLSRKKITWINERFIANLQTLIELDEKISGTKFKKNIVSGMLERIEYENTLNILKKELERTQNYAEKYNRELSKRLKVIISTIEIAIKLMSKA